MENKLHIDIKIEFCLKNMNIGIYDTSCIIVLIAKITNDHHIPGSKKK